MATNFKDLQAKLDTVIAELHSDDLDIDKAMDLYKQGKKLIKQLENYLQTAKNQIDRLT